MVNRRDFLRTAGLSGAALALTPVWGRTEIEKTVRPNVLLICVDDLRSELGCYGSELAVTPHMDRLAASGVRFENAYCQQAICGPSRIGLLTSLYPGSHKSYGLDKSLRTVCPDTTTMNQAFRDAGYFTASLGKVEHHDSDRAGWDCFDKMREYPGVRGRWLSEESHRLIDELEAEADRQGLTGKNRDFFVRPAAFEAPDVADDAYVDGRIAGRALELMHQYQDRPFFVATGFYRPHLPFNAPKQYWDLYDAAAFKLPAQKGITGTPDWCMTDWGELRNYHGIPKKGDLDPELARKLIHGYHASMSYVDAQIGRLLDGLDALGLAENTVVVLWGDHGFKIGEYGDWCKHTNLEIDTHIPLVIRAPGIQPSTSPALCETVDVFPTLAELCGVAASSSVEGLSLVPVLKDPQRKWKQAAFSVYPRRQGFGRSLRHDRWRYVEWRNGKNEVTARELYDHHAGPLAKQNLAGDPAFNEVVARLSKMLGDGWRTARVGI